MQDCSQKTLGLHLGTSYIGWAVTEPGEKNTRVLREHGVRAFDIGVAISKEGESPATEKRTQARQARRMIRRRKERKIRLVGVLVRLGWCPSISPEELALWKSDGINPSSEEFRQWLRTSAVGGCKPVLEKNPYRDRYRCLTEELDLSVKEDRYTLGRALYHLAQRRGYRGPENEEEGKKESGVVLAGIGQLDKEMREAGCRFLGEYFYLCFRENGRKKIRTRYTSREQYLAEFNAICEKQGISESIKQELWDCIFFQRPLKSNKGSVGRCTFETDKLRCMVSHPSFEEYRMLSLLNYIRVMGPGDQAPRSLTDAERDAVLPLFFRKSAADFPFEDIAKKIAGKGNYRYRGDDMDESKAFVFNYQMNFTISGCPTSAAILRAADIKPVSGWREELCSLYTRGEGKTEDQIINDLWHTLVFFNDEKKKADWYVNVLGAGEENALELARFRVRKGYANLSLKAINKILVYLRKGHILSDSIFYANLGEAVLPNIRKNAEKMKEIEENVSLILSNETAVPEMRFNKFNEVTDYLLLYSDKEHVRRLYHPSLVENSFRAEWDRTTHCAQLNSPQTGSMKNPVVMRALTQLRLLMNTLLRDGVIDMHTRINISFSGELNDANTRKAIQVNQKEEEALKKQYADTIREWFTTMGDYEPTSEDILKYRLYEEQNHICPFTGRTISPSMFLGLANEFEIDYIVPVSLGGNTSMANMVLCDREFNRKVKKTALPSQLANYDDVLARISGWKDTAAALSLRIDRDKKKSREATDNNAKASAIFDMRLCQIRLRYWRTKIGYFLQSEAKDGFRNKDIVNYETISNYAKNYLASVFPNTFVVKDATVAEFRKVWKLQGRGEEWDRTLFTNSCINAVVVSCMRKHEYDALNEYFKKEEDCLYGKGKKPFLRYPWDTFVKDMKELPKHVLVSHAFKDKMPKQTKKACRVNGKIQRREDGSIIYATGDTARGVLHEETFYGAIKNGGEIRYVIRKDLGSVVEKEAGKFVEKIVDKAVREKVCAAMKEHGSLKEALANTIWMNKEKGIPIRKVRVYSHYKNYIELKQQRDASRKPYKRPFCVVNDSNYCMLLYGKDDYLKHRVISNYEAARYYNGKTEGPLFPERDKKGKELRGVLYNGQMVLFYQNSPEELRSCSPEELYDRLYKVVMLSGGQIKLCHHNEAGSAKSVNTTFGAWREGDGHRGRILLGAKNFKALIAGQHFDIDPTGKIVFKEM